MLKDKIKKKTIIQKDFKKIIKRMSIEIDIKTKFYIWLKSEIEGKKSN
jgi:hypothetical protein